MATLAETRRDPAAYLGASGTNGQATPDDRECYELYFSAVEALIEAGRSEADALAAAWGGGDFIGASQAILGATQS